MGVAKVRIYDLGGSILPRQAPNKTTAESRQNPFELLVAPHIFKQRTQAEGVLFWDDGESIVESFDNHNFYHWLFNYTEAEDGGRLSVTTKRQAKKLVIPTLDIIEIFNYVSRPDFGSFSIDGKKVNINIHTSHYDDQKKILYISSEKLMDISKQGTTTLSWKNSKKEPQRPSSPIEVMRCHPKNGHSKAPKRTTYAEMPLLFPAGR
ncbi:hypothetical protein COOONC_10607 [Cooperia oncophora]